MPHRRRKKTRRTRPLAVRVLIVSGIVVATLALSAAAFYSGRGEFLERWNAPVRIDE
jgi:hypothetical protein